MDSSANTTLYAEAADAIRQAIEAYVWFRLETNETSMSVSRDTAPGVQAERGHVVLNCDASGLIIGATQSEQADDAAAEGNLVGRRLVEIIGENHQRALEQLLTRRPHASLDFKFVRHEGQARRCRITVRRSMRPSGQRAGTVIVVYGLEQRVPERVDSKRRAATANA